MIPSRCVCWVLAVGLTAPAAMAAQKAPQPSAPSPLPEGLSRRPVAYRIDASLDPRRKSVAGSETVSYRNDSPDALQEIPFHLYPNAFSGDRTLHSRETLREEGPHPPLEGAIRDRTWGRMEVRSVALADGTDLAGLTTLEETTMRVRLPQALAPGQTVSIRIVWEVKLPRIIDRMGYWGEHFDLMQWFPKPGVYRDGAWNVHEYHAHSEFFADFGTFDVTLTAPARFRVEATGVRISERENPDGTRTVVYHADDVHDFAWVADPNARIAKEKIRGVEVVFFYQPGHASLVPRILSTARACLEHYGAWYMPYPYPRIVIVDLPMGLGGGMEYPMLFTVSMAAFLPRSYVGPESVTAHEFGHQYWYGIVATNEFEEAWLDEGINTYSTARLLDAAIIRHRPAPTLTAMARFAFARVLGKGIPLDLGLGVLNLSDLMGFRRTPFQETSPTLLGYPVNPYNLSVPGLTSGYLLARKDNYARNGREDPIQTPSWEFYPGRYADTVYSKTTMVLKTLERLVGPEKMGRILKEYVARHRFAHPGAAEFLEVAGEVGGADLRPFTDPLVFGTAWIDFAVGEARSERVRYPVGFLLPDKVGGATRESKGGQASGGKFETEVVVRRLGDAILPVDVLFTFEDGSKVRERWDAASRWKCYSYVRGSRLRSVVVDPDHVYAIDLNFNNNSRTLRRQGAAVNKVTAIWLFWLQNYLHLVSSLS